MTRAWEIFAPMCWNAFEDPGGLSRKAGNLLAAAEPQIYENVFVKKTYLMHACSLICLCVIVSAAKPLVLGPLGRVSGAVLSLIGPSALSVNVLPGLCHSGSLCVSSNLPGLVFFVLGIGFLADKMLLVFCFYVSHSRSCNPWICVLLASDLNI